MKPFSFSAAIIVLLALFSFMPSPARAQDADSDGLGDLFEASLGTDPDVWDSDGDGLPDGFEYDNSTGRPEAWLLNPLAAADGAADFDADGIANAHEFYNGTDAWVVDPAGGAGCFYWGDSDGDGFLSPSDVAGINASLKGLLTAYTRVYPPGTETMELDMDGFRSPSDKGLLLNMIKGMNIEPMASRPDALVKAAPASGGALVTVGDTIRVSVKLHNQAGSYTPGFGVVFSIDPSSDGRATLLGGDGAAAAGRYDLSGPIAAQGLASMVLRVDAEGAVVVNVSVPSCGTTGVGRWAPALSLPAAFVISGALPGATDADGDGFPNIGSRADCNDNNPAIYPGAVEITCSGVDEDCDGPADDAPNADADGYDVCGPADAVNPDGKVADCNDASYAVRPGRVENLCDGVDDNCNGLADDAPDADGDGYDRCGPWSPVNPDGRASDCSDTNAAIHPNATEISCNYVDEDCSGSDYCYGGGGGSCCPTCYCTMEWMPVCGINGVTYSNFCVASQFCVTVACDHECPCW